MFPKSFRIYIGTGHVADVYAPSKYDPPTLKEARQLIMQFIAGLLSENITNLSINSSPSVSLPSSFNADLLAMSVQKNGFEFSPMSFNWSVSSSSTDLNTQSKTDTKKTATGEKIKMKTQSVTNNGISNLAPLGSFENPFMQSVQSDSDKKTVKSAQWTDGQLMNIS